MAKGYMSQIAKMLGIEIGERFKIQRIDDVSGMTEAYFDESGLHILNTYLNNGDIDRYLAKLLMGKIKIEKKPWKPKHGEKYYCPCVQSRDVGSYSWANYSLDYAMLALNMVYRTREEALEHLAEDYERLTGKKLEDWHGIGD